MILIAKISVVLCMILLGIALIQWMQENPAREHNEAILSIAIFCMEQEKIRLEEERLIQQKAEEEQKKKKFYMDFRIGFGSAFGGFCATGNDGRRKKGTVGLDQILLYGRHASGKDFTYYIEEQDIEICAMDDPEQLLIRSKKEPFDIRRSGQGRDEGSLVRQAVIQKDTLYFIILESKHEISIRATKGC